MSKVVGAALDYAVVIPTLGRNLAFLAQALDSVRAQTVAAREIIVVVDGDADVADGLRASQPDLTVIALPERRGEAVARQAGIEAASAEWVAFLDDDDLWTPDKQERTAEYLSARPDCQAVRAGYWMFAAPDDPVEGLNGQTVELRGHSLADLVGLAAPSRRRNDLSYLDIRGRSLELLLEFNRGVIGTTVVRRSLLARIDPVPAGQRPAGDYLLFCNVAAETEWHLIEERLEFYRVHAGQDTVLPGPDGVRGIMLAKRRAWAAHGAIAPRPLAEYGSRYRAEFRRLWWSQARQGQIANAWAVFRDALPLLPRVRDRVLLLVPEPVAWRLHRLRRRTDVRVVPAW